MSQYRIVKQGEGVYYVQQRKLRYTYLGNYEWRDEWINLQSCVSDHAARGYLDNLEATIKAMGNLADVIETRTIKP